MDITDEEYRAFATRMKRPVPGQSLTNSPETPWPWEKPPQFTSKEDALSFFFDYFTEQERHQAIIETLDEGVPVMDIVQMFLTQSFRKGEINPYVTLSRTCCFYDYGFRRTCRCRGYKNCRRSR
jgi:hypothetical protein